MELKSSTPENSYWTKFFLTFTPQMSDKFKTKSDLYAEIQELEMELALTLDDAILYKKKYSEEVNKHEGLKYKYSEDSKLLKKYRDERDEWKKYGEELELELKQCIADYNELRKLFTMKEYGIGEEQPYEVVIPDHQPSDDDIYNEE